jgi:hypothetical protein
MSNKYFKNPYKTSSRRQITARILKEEAANAPAGYTVGVYNMIWIKHHVTHKIIGVYYNVKLYID